MAVARSSAGCRYSSVGIVGWHYGGTVTTVHTYHHQKNEGGFPIYSPGCMNGGPLLCARRIGQALTLRNREAIEPNQPFAQSLAPLPRTQCVPTIDGVESTRLIDSTDCSSVEQAVDSTDCSSVSNKRLTLLTAQASRKRLTLLTAQASRTSG